MTSSILRTVVVSINWQRKLATDSKGDGWMDGGGGFVLPALWRVKHHHWCSRFDSPLPPKWMGGGGGHSCNDALSAIHQQYILWVTDEGRPIANTTMDVRCQHI